MNVKEDHQGTGEYEASIVYAAKHSSYKRGANGCAILQLWLVEDPSCLVSLSKRHLPRSADLVHENITNSLEILLRRTDLKENSSQNKETRRKEKKRIKKERIKERKCLGSLCSIFALRSASNTHAKMR